MNYTQAVEYLEALTDFERLGFRRHFADTVSLDSARRFAELLDNPHLQVPAVHIAGTKGKGSTAAMVERVLREAGYRTGLFSSPHLVSFRERVRVNGEPVSEESMARLVSQVQPVLEQVRVTDGFSPCTFFEAYFGIAALHFLAEEVDVAVYEVGLGGRLDATNLLNPLVSAITTIGFDHTAILGNTLDAIAREKAGIAKPGVPLVVARGQQGEAFSAISQVAESVGAPLVQGPITNRLEPPQRAARSGPSGLTLPLDQFEVLWPSASGHESRLAGPVTQWQVRSSLLGAHQATNLGVALGILDEMALRGYTVRWEHVARGLCQVRWPGRFDIRQAHPYLVFDCAHNPDSARALARALPEYLDLGRLVLVIGMSEDKDIAGFADRLAGLGAQVLLTRANLDRALDVDLLRERGGPAWSEAEVVPGVAEACRRAFEIAGSEGTVCVTGSFYVVGEAMTALGLMP